MCNLSVRACSRVNWSMRKVTAVNGRSAASATVFKLRCLTNHAQIFEGVCVGELRAIIRERGQIAGVRVEANHLRLSCIDSGRLSLCVRS